MLIFLAVGVGITILKSKQAHTSRTIRRGAAAFDANRSREAIERMRQRDATFVPMAFLGRVQKAFLRIQHAWCNQDLDDVRAFISDGIYERFSLQILEQKEFGWRDHMENIRILHCDVDSLDDSEHFDTLNVRITASAVDYRQSLDTGKRIGGSSAPETFTEYWSFIRRTGVTTDPDKPGLMEGNCPNCGAAIEHSQSANCQYCEAHLRSGAFDWVLAEITQACEWRPGQAAAIPGMTAMQEKDPGVNTQHIEDRASVMFWRKDRAQRVGDAQPLRKIATEAYAGQVQQEVAGDDATRTWYGECAVGGVDTTALLPGEEFDRALVTVRWAGAKFSRGPAGRPVKRGPKGLFVSVFVLQRSANVRTDLDTTVSSSHCPSCGAPEAGGASGACEYCGEVLNDGLHDWVLAAVHSQYDPRVTELLRQARELSEDSVPPPTPAGVAAAADGNGVPTSAGLMAWMIHTTLVDGAVEPREREMLQAAARKARISEAKLQTMIEAGIAGKITPPQPKDDEQGRQWLGAMAEVTLADGKIHAAEKKLLTDVGQRLGFGKYDVNYLLRQKRAELYKRAKEQIRQAGSGPPAVPPVPGG